MAEHLVERHHPARRREAAAAWQAGRPEFSAIVTRFFPVGIGAAGLFGFWHANENVVRETQRFQNAGADHVAVILSRHRLDHHRLGEMRGAGVVLKARAWRPFKREVADLGPHFRVVGPGGAADVGVGEAAGMGHNLLNRYGAFAAGGEFRQQIGDTVHE